MLATGRGNDPRSLPLDAIANRSRLLLALVPSAVYDHHARELLEADELPDFGEAGRGATWPRS